MMNRRKNLFLFYELNEDEKTYHSNLVRLYTNPLIIDEDNQIEILGICQLENWTDFYCNNLVLLDMLRNSKDYIIKNSDIHFIYGSSFYFRPVLIDSSEYGIPVIPVDMVDSRGIDFMGDYQESHEYEEFMQETIETAIELADLNALCSNITLTMLSGHFLKPVAQDKMEYLIINSEITIDKL